MNNPLVELARQTIELYVKEGKTLPIPAVLTLEMQQKAGVFVSLKKQDQLRGCIGTFEPATPNVAQEIIRNAIESAVHDPRFSPLQADELRGLEISVDVLSSPEEVVSISDLDAKKYGMIVSAGARCGLLLPDLPGVNSPEEQLAICRRKAGIGEKELVTLQRFEVRRYT